MRMGGLRLLGAEGYDGVSEKYYRILQLNSHAAQMHSNKSLCSATKHASAQHASWSMRVTSAWLYSRKTARVSTGEISLGTALGITFADLPETS
jgi:hypothetical protein